VQLPTQDQVLAVHCAPSLALKWLGPRLPSFMALHPTVNIRLTTGAEPLDLGAQREIDVSIAYGPPRHSAGLDVCALGDEHIAPLVAPHLLQRDESPEQLLARWPLIDSQLSPVGWPQWFAFHELAIPVGPRPSFDRAAMAIAAAVDGLGVALESTRLAARELERGELVVLGAERWPALVRPVHFMSVRHTERSRGATAAFVQWVQAQAGLVDSAP
jgi:DNA-binding transcriptional LysR family regulator